MMFFLSEESQLNVDIAEAEESEEAWVYIDVKRKLIEHFDYYIYMIIYVYFFKYSCSNSHSVSKIILDPSWWFSQSYSRSLKMTKARPWRWTSQWMKMDAFAVNKAHFSSMVVWCLNLRFWWLHQHAPSRLGVFISISVAYIIAWISTLSHPTVLPTHVVNPFPDQVTNTHLGGQLTNSIVLEPSVRVFDGILPCEHLEALKECSRTCFQARKIWELTRNEKSETSPEFILKYILIHFLEVHISFNNRFHFHR